MTNEPQTNNVIVKLRFYQTKEHYTDNPEMAEHRDFVSCQDSYSYLNYVHTGASENVSSDYEQYIANKEKSFGAFNQDGLLNDEQKLDLRHQLQTTQSVIWDMIISFRENFGDEYCRDYDQAYKFLKKELPKFFNRAGLYSDNIVWYAGLHENTENKHIHISFFEKEPLYFDNGGKLKYHSGTISKDLLIATKFTFEKALTKPTAQILKARKDMLYSYNALMSRTDMARKLKRLLLNLYTILPKDGRHSYDSENMLRVKKDVDGVTEFILTKNTQTRDTYWEFENALKKFEEWKDERNYKEGSNYKKDLFRRLGNITINTAIELGKLHDELEKLDIKTAQYKAYKKAMRQREWDKLLDLLEYYAKCDEMEIKNFIYRQKQSEAYAKQQEYYRIQSDREKQKLAKEYGGFEM